MIQTNAMQVAAAIDAHGLLVGARVQAAVAHHGLRLQSMVKRNASLPRSGPPGPRLQTGDYVRSMYLHVGVLVAEVGTNKPQARRLEFGFTGMDALGRNYDQPPYPHFGPAIAAIEEPFMTSLLLAMGTGW